MMKEVTTNTSLSDRVFNAVDAGISLFSPRWAYKRKSYRQATKAFKRATKRLNNISQDFNNFTWTSEKDLYSKRDDAVEKSIYLNAENGFGAGITETVACNVIGSGFTAQSRVDEKEIGLSKERKESIQNANEKFFKKWSKKADITGYGNFKQQQDLVYRNIKEYGEAIILPIRTNEFPYIQYQIINPKRLRTPSDLRTNSAISEGIEFDEFGRPIKYYIKKTSSGFNESSNNYQVIDATDSDGRKNIFHIFNKKRPGQIRGMPYFSPVLSLFNDLSEYMEAELVKARAAACIALVVESKDPWSAAGANANGETDSRSGREYQSFSPGEVLYTNSGEEVKMLNPALSSDVFSPFVDKILMLISTALGLPLDLVTKIFTNSYSSSKAALQEARNFFRKEQGLMADNYCQVVWEAVIEAGYLHGELDMPNFYQYRDEYLIVNWIANGWDWIDPQKEVKANVEANKNNMITLADIYGKKGKDWEQELEQIAREKAKILSLGLVVEDLHPVDRKHQDDVEIEEERRTA